MPDVITACAILHNILRKQANEDLEAFDAMMNNGGVEDDDDDAHLNIEISYENDDGGPQSEITNGGEDLRRSLASYLGSQREVLP